MAQQLIREHGADVSARSVDGSTPLHWAAREGHAPVVRLLLDAVNPKP